MAALERVLVDLQHKLEEYGAIEADAGREFIRIEGRPAVLDDLQGLVLTFSSLLIQIE